MWHLLSKTLVLRFPFVTQSILKHIEITKEYMLKRTPLYEKPWQADLQKYVTIYRGAVCLQFLGWVLGCMVEVKVSQRSICLKINLGLVANVTFN